MNRKILVTGGCGFIGSNFIRHVLANLPDCRVVNLDLLTYAGNLENLKDIKHGPSYRFIRGDIADSRLVEEIFSAEKVDTVVHFAAETHVDRSIYGPADFMQSNIIGTFSLLEAARKYWLSGAALVPAEQARFLHISTDEVYGALGETGFFSENSPYRPRSPYSASKASADHLVNAYHHTYGLPAMITNCSNNYGPYQFPEKLIPLMINNAMTGKDLPLYGDGRQIRDWLYVIDHCAAVITVLGKGLPGQTYNIGGNNEKTNIEVVSMICDLLDQELGLQANGQPRRLLIKSVQDRPGHDRRYAIDAGKIRRELGWEPRTAFTEGIRDTIRWYLSNQDWLKSLINGSYQQYYREMYEGRK